MAETAWSDAEDSRLLGLVLDVDLNNLSCRTIRDMSYSYSLINWVVSSAAAYVLGSFFSTRLGCQD